MFKHHLFCLLLASSATFTTVSAAVSVTRLNPTAAELRFGDGQILTLDFYGPNIVRLFLDPQGGIMRDPVATPPAQILVGQPRRSVGVLAVEQDATVCRIQSSQLLVAVDRESGAMSFTDRRSGKVVAATLPPSLGDEPRDSAPFAFDAKSSTLRLTAQEGEQFYGGGVQNGRYAHAGQTIAIENTNNWVDGGVASPTPFYWSTAGYGILWHTFRPGKYDFGASEKGVVRLTHEEPYLDVFFMADDGCVALLNDFYQLTGHPVLLPKFGFYEGHLNAYNRDYWAAHPQPLPREGSSNGSSSAQVTPPLGGAGGGLRPGALIGESGILFEDGRSYKESQKPVEGGIRESLNGEVEGGYQFSARAVIDRYEHADMPLGWLLPNDGYGAGYGQTETLEGNVENLRQFGDYARSKGVEIGLWTQSDLYPKEGVEPLLQRDIVREVRDAGVRVLKTDVAWVGAGYSFGLNGVADVGRIMPYYGDDARPFIISLDGWAGTQRYAGIWTGDQTGGDWEYIRYHIPTFIGAGLSGQPNITSDMDGIFGGRNVPVNVREYQWKAFTPMQLNMDGWGSNPKYPQALGEPATSINRWYLKLKSMLMPYTYTIAHEAIDGMPMVRPVAAHPQPLPREGGANEPSSSQVTPPLGGDWGGLLNYEFLYGPSLLVAPIYQNTAADGQGNDIRNFIYLPEGEWVDYFTGYCYEGGRILNHFDAPLWKLPVFVRRGAIIPMIHAHNNPGQIDPHTRAFIIYPKGHTDFTAYDDDGRTLAYQRGESATTHVVSNLDDAQRRLTLTVEPTRGGFKGFEPMKSTEFVVNLQDKPKKITLKLNGRKVRLDEAQSLEDFTENTNVFFYDAAPELNLWPTPNSEMSRLHVQPTPRLYVCVADADITATTIEITVDGYTFDTSNRLLSHTGTLAQPTLQTDDFEDGCISPSAYTLPLRWTPVENADYYEIEHQGQLYSTIHPTGASSASSSLGSPSASSSLGSSIVPGSVAGGSSASLPSFTLEALQPETNYEVRVRAVNRDGAGPWAREKFRTSPDPLRYAIHGITAECSVPDQPGQDISHLFDFDEGTVWHTSWDKPNSAPFDIILDLHVVATIDSIHYLPRADFGNGTITRAKLEYSLDKQSWTASPAPSVGGDKGGSQTSPASGPLGATGACRYLRIHVEESLGGFGSGRQIYVFRNPEAEFYIPGDINHDNRIDENDLTSYMNYTGLRRGDGDFEGYVSRGDLNNNGLIDAYDISAVGIELEGGAGSRKVEPVAGSISVTADKRQAAAGDIVTLTVNGRDLRSVNALSFALPYDASVWEYAGMEAEGMKEMRNLTNDRLHTSGQKALYPTFVNCGDHPCLEDGTLMVIRFRAKRPARVSLVPQDGMIVDKNLNAVTF